MSDNRLIVAAAGSGKTQHIIDCVSRLPQDRVLITTFTESNRDEIKRRLQAMHGCRPERLVVQTWFSFLLQHGVRPYQDTLDLSLHREQIGFRLTSERSGQKRGRDGKPILGPGGHPIYWGERDVRHCYFTPRMQMYSDKIAKFVVATNKKSGGAVMSRLSGIFKHVFVDEVQDMAGYDLDLLGLLIKSSIFVTMVGDPRQTVYQTHNSNRHQKYRGGKIVEFIEEGIGKKTRCEIDLSSLAKSHRNNGAICDLASQLYPGLPPTLPCNCSECHAAPAEGHDGVFLVRTGDTFQYLERFKPLQIRMSRKTNVSRGFETKTFGDSKGLTCDRVLIYPTAAMLKWIADRAGELKPSTRAKLYVGLTRARHSAAIVVPDDHGLSSLPEFRP